MSNLRGSGRRGRIAAWVVVATVAVAAFASLGGVGLAQNAIGLHQYQYGKKVIVCHKGKSIRVSTRSWLAHKRHGDILGTCKVWKKHGKHGKHWKARHWKKQWKKGRGDRSDDAKALKKGRDGSGAVVAVSDSDAGSGREGKSERGGKSEDRGKSRGHGKDRDRR